MPTTPLTLEPNRWYAWQMLPGYFGKHCVPYCCPIWVGSVVPLKSGQGILRIEFWNTGYAVGVQDFCVDLKVLHRTQSYLIGVLVEGDQELLERSAVVSVIEFGWIERYCPELWRQSPPSAFGPLAISDVSVYLDLALKRET